MSRQDKETCAICDKLAGYDDRKSQWWGKDRDGARHSIICSQCRYNLIMRMAAFLDLGGVSYTEGGLEIPWHDVARILGRVKQDFARRVSYLVTAEEEYEAGLNVRLPIECLPSLPIEAIDKRES